MAEDDLTSTMAAPATRPGDEFPLSDLKEGAPDKRGKEVTDILWAVHDFKIYKTDKGISPQFSDDPALAETQRENYLSLGPELADLNNRISKRLSNVLRVLYFTICVVATVAITVGLTIYTEQMSSPATETILGLNMFDVSVAAVMGSLGALLSTAIGLRSLSIDPTATLTINITYAIQRMLVGVLGAVILHIALKSGLVNNLLGTTQNTVAEGNTAGKLAFLSVLAGFSERLVPNLLDRSAERHSKDGNRKEQKTPAPDEPGAAGPGAG